MKSQSVSAVSRRSATAVIALAAAMFSSPAFAQPVARPGGPVSPSAANAAKPVLSLDGAVYTVADIARYAELINSSDAAARRGLPPSSDVEDFVITKAHADLFTTVSLSDKEFSDLPTPYPHASQRGYLGNLLNDHAKSAVDSTTPALETWLRDNMAEFVRPETLSARHIFQETSATVATSSTVAVRARMEGVKREADAGTSFGLLARTHSEAGSGASGGLLPEVQAGRASAGRPKPINPALERALFALTPGRVSDIVQTSAGMHLVYLESRETTYTPTVADLVSSGILPQRLIAQKAQAIRTDLIKAVADKGAVPTPPAGEAMTTSTVVFTLDGQSFTMGHLERIYGPDFRRAVDRSKARPDEMANLGRRALELEAGIRAVAALKLDTETTASRVLGTLAARALAQRRFGAIMAEASPIGDDAVKAQYEKVKEQTRSAVVSGWVLTVKAPAGADAPAREAAKAKVEAARKRIVAGEDFAKVARETSQDDLASSGGRVDAHAPFSLESEATRAFDRVSESVKVDGDVSEVTARDGDGGFVVAKLEKRGKGEPRPLESLRGRLLQIARREAEADLRRLMLLQLEAKGRVKLLEGATEFGLSPTASPAPKS